MALKYGPLVYNVEALDNQNIDQKTRHCIHFARSGALTSSVVSLLITGKWADGTESRGDSQLCADESCRSPACIPREEETTSSPNGPSPSLASKVWI